MCRCPPTCRFICLFWSVHLIICVSLSISLSFPQQWSYSMRGFFCRSVCSAAHASAMRHLGWPWSWSHVYPPSVFLILSFSVSISLFSSRVFHPHFFFVTDNLFVWFGLVKELINLLILERWRCFIRGPLFFQPFQHPDPTLPSTQTKNRGKISSTATY